MRVGVFVDAGYLFAEGGRLLTGTKQRRESLTLNIDAVRSAFSTVTKNCCDLRLLRIYWYDAMRQGHPTDQHKLLADADDIKVRLGQINSVGEQKGVDALIITDMAELARNKAISDAVLVSGDEDLRVGVLLAQQFGVRVHLLGIHPARGNQSPSLRQECDTTREWDRSVVQTMLTQSTGLAEEKTDVDGNVILVELIRNYVSTFTYADIQTLRPELAARGNVPPQYDKTLLQLGCQHLDRSSLTTAERKNLRETFIGLVNARSFDAGQ